MRYSSDGRKCGERGQRKVKRSPITGVELEALRTKNIAIENEETANEFACITCGDEVEHNYGTDEYPQCILCGNER